MLKSSLPVVGLRLWVSVCLALLAPFAVTAPAVHADSFTVDIQADQNNGCTPGACSLREAILAANDTSGPDVISLPAGTYTLTLAGLDDLGAVGDLDILGDVTLLGAGAATTSINANGLDRAVDVVSGQVTLTGVTIRNGIANNGGGVFLHAGSALTLTDTTIQNNAASNNGGGLYNNGGQLTFNHAQVFTNTALNAASGNGGGLYNVANGTVVITNATVFQGNLANYNSAINAGLGGGFHTQGGVVTIFNSTLTANYANDGGAISVGASGAVTISNSLILSNISGDDGAGIENDNGTVGVYATAILSNTASFTDTNGEGGGVNNGNGGVVSIYNSLLNANSGHNGGGLSNDGGSVMLVNSTVSDNTANKAGSGRGGGIQSDGTALSVTLTLSNSLIANNTSLNEGGGIYSTGAISDPSQLRLNNVTLSGNVSTGGAGGGLRNNAGSFATLANVTLANNNATSGDGLRNAGTLTLRNSLLADNDAQDCNNTGSLTSQGYNLKSDSSCGSVFNATGDMTNTLATLVGPLQDNGGPTLSQAPLSASPGAINLGNPTGCLSPAGLVLIDDQRGFMRPVGGRCDIGAVEYTVSDLGVDLSLGPANVVPGLPITYTLVVTNSGAITVTDAVVTNTTSAVFTNPTWTCTGLLGSTCPASGTGALDALLTLSPMGSVTFTITGAIASNATGALTHTAGIAMPVGVNDAVPANNTTAKSDNLTPQSDVGISNTDGQAAALPGSPLTYTIVVTNAGPSDAVSVWVTDVFPAALENVNWSCTASSGSTCPVNGAGGLAAVVDIQADDTITFLATGTLTVSATGPLTNTATLSGASDITPDNNVATDLTQLTAAVDLGIAITTGQTSTVPGGPLTFTLVMSNAGPSLATDALITSSFPTVIENVFWSCAASVGSLCGVVSGTSDISATASLPVNGVVTFTASGMVNASATGMLTTTAGVSPSAGDVELGPLPNLATEVDSLTPLADVLITLTDGQVTTTAGALITYTLLITNPGPSNASAVMVTDIFPSEIENISWSCAGTGGGSCPASGAGPIIANTVYLPANARVTFVAVGHLALTASGLLTNTAAATVPLGVTDPRTNNNTSTDTTEIVPAAILYLLFLPLLRR